MTIQNAAALLWLQRMFETPRAETWGSRFPVTARHLAGASPRPSWHRVPRILGLALGHACLPRPKRAHTHTKAAPMYL